MWLVVERESLTMAALRTRLGRASVDVVRHLYGDRAPGPEAMRLYRDKLGVPLGAWFQTPRRAFVIPALRAAG